MIIKKKYLALEVTSFQDFKYQARVNHRTGQFLDKKNYSDKNYKLLPLTLMTVSK